MDTVADETMDGTVEDHTSVKNGKEVINNNKGGTWVGAHECADKELSRLMVRSSPNAPKGNNELLNTLDCINIEESKILLGSSVSDLIDKNVSVGYQYRKYEEGNIFSFLWSIIEVVGSLKFNNLLIVKWLPHGGWLIYIFTIIPYVLYASFVN